MPHERRYVPRVGKNLAPAVRATVFSATAAHGSGDHQLSIDLLNSYSILYALNSTMISIPLSIQSREKPQQLSPRSLEHQSHQVGGAMCSIGFTASASTVATTAAAATTIATVAVSLRPHVPTTSTSITAGHFIRSTELSFDLRH